MRYFVKYSSGREIPVDVTILANGEIRAEVEGRSFKLDAYDHRGAVFLNLEGQSVELWMDGKVPEIGVSSADKRFHARVENERTRALAGASGKAGGAADKLIVSPMPGRVLKVLVNEGDEVHAGKPVVVVEAMKMENELAALHDGKVKKVYVTPGTAVEGGAKLVEIE
jgi:glutaconyl-CoA/methylmalonyl-CoA decarboxylase subunit gamma